MSYDLDAFVSDCRAILARDPDPRAARRSACTSSNCSPIGSSSRPIAAIDVPRGLKVLYEDPDLGFQVLAHINDKASVSPPHDHGASWAIYGQATHYTDMIGMGARGRRSPIRPSSSR